MDLQFWVGNQIIFNWGRWQLVNWVKVPTEMTKLNSTLMALPLENKLLSNPKKEYQNQILNFCYRPLKYKHNTKAVCPQYPRAL